MPSQLEMVPRIAKVNDRITAAAAMLSSRFGMEMAPVLPGKDPELQRVRSQESVAGLLESLVAVTSPELDQITALQTRLAEQDERIALLRAEADNLTAAWQASQQAVTQVSEANAGWASFGEKIWQLLNDAVEDADLRETLEAAGFIEAEFSETNGWAVSVIGVGPNLAELLEQSKPMSAATVDAEIAQSPESLMGRTKADLESLAAELGIETGKLKTKAEIVDAILGAKSATGKDA